MHLPIVIICLASYWIVLYLLYRAALISPAAIQVLLGEVHTNHLWELTGFRTPSVLQQRIYGEALLERGTFSGFKRLGVSLVEVHERRGSEICYFDL